MNVAARKDLLELWIDFCKAATPGARYWIADDLWERLFDRLGQEARFHPEEPAYKSTITYRGGYEHGGLTFYRKSWYPHPIRRVLRPQYPGVQEFHAR